jgi:UDP:flavonoid glycosyltransferase YjiC (YdhE family)
MTPERAQRFVRDGAGMGPPSQSMWTDAEIESYVTAEAKFFRERGVRVAVTGFTLTTLLSTRLAGVKLVTEHAGSFVPPVWERGMIEPWLRSPLPLVDRLPYAARRFVANLGIHHVQHYCAGFNRVARRLGVEGVPSFANLLLGDLTLVPEVPEVLGIPAAELEAWRPGAKGYRAGLRLKYSGPLFAELDRAVPERVQRFLEGPRPIAYVAITSSTADQVRAVVNALRPVDARILVAGTVHALADLECDQVLVEGVLPSQRIMPRVDLAITAGGQGSVQCAMAAGTPLIVLPLQPEQDWNGQLIERQGAGQRMSFADSATPKLAELARKLLADPSVRRNAQRVRDIYARSDGPSMAAEAIMEYARVPSQHVPASRCSA